ncbi:hypothetical protein [Bacillus mexicanus]|uniref:hypothetical protein n=1 Tax=Bacillus mexicanus TaxID=2834415 RepID=UPI003D1B6FD3
MWAWKKFILSMELVGATEAPICISEGTRKRARTDVAADSLEGTNLLASVADGPVRGPGINMRKIESGGLH